MFVTSSKSNTAKKHIFDHLTKPVQPIIFNKGVNNKITKQSLLAGDVFYKINIDDFKDNKLNLEMENTIDGILIAFYKYSDFAGNKDKADYYPTRTKEEYETIDNPELIKGKNYEFTYAFIINECKEDAGKFSDYNIKQKILNFYSKDHSLIFPHPYISKDLTDLLGDLRSVDPNTYYLFNSSSGPVVISMEEFLRQRDTFTSVLLRDISNLSIAVNKRNDRINDLLSSNSDLISKNVDLDVRILVLKGDISFLEDSVASKILKINSLNLDVLNGTLKIKDLEEKVEELEANNENLIISLCSLEGLDAAVYVTADGFDYSKFFEDFDGLRETYNTQKRKLTVENEGLKVKISKLQSDKSKLKNVLERLLYTPVTPIENLHGDGVQGVTYLLHNEIEKLDKLKIFFEDDVDFINIICERIIFINKLISQITNDEINKSQLIASLTAENDTLKSDLNLKVEELFKRNVDILELQKKIRNTDDDAVLSDSLDIIISFKKLIDEGQIAEKIIKIEEIITDIKDDADESKKAQKIMKIKGILDDIDGADYAEKMDDLQKMLKNIDFFTDFINQEGIILDGTNPMIDIINLNTLKSYSDILARIYNFSFDESENLEPISLNETIVLEYLYSSITQSEVYERVRSNLSDSGVENPLIVVSEESTQITIVEPVVTTVNCDSYISNLIEDFEMFAPTDNINNILKSSYSNKLSSINNNSKLGEFTEIIFNVAKAFNLSSEETAQFWAIMAQESGIETDLAKFNGVDIDKQIGIAQITPLWYDDSTQFLEGYKFKYSFNEVDLSTINSNLNLGLDLSSDSCDSELSISNCLTDSGYAKLLRGIKNNKNSYYSVIWACAFFKRNQQQLVSTTKDISGKKFIYDMSKNWDYKASNNIDSIDAFFADAYMYYSTNNIFEDKGITEYNYAEHSAEFDSALAKTEYYLSFKKIMCDAKSDNIIAVKYKTKFGNLPICEISKNNLDSSHNKELNLDPTDFEEKDGLKSTESIGDKLANYAYDQRGFPYRTMGRNSAHADTTSTGQNLVLNSNFDCIGLVADSFLKLGYLGQSTTNYTYKFFELFKSSLNLEKYIVENKFCIEDNSVCFNNSNHITGSKFVLDGSSSNINNFDFKKGDVVIFNNYSHLGIYYKDNYYLNATNRTGVDEVHLDSLEDRLSQNGISYPIVVLRVNEVKSENANVEENIV